MTRIDYDRDHIKHFVRYRGWLDACKYRNKCVQRAIRGDRRSQKLTYFTFCASNAIDVFMLEQAGILTRTKKTGRLDRVFFCEYEPDEFLKVASLIGSSEAGFGGDFKEFVLFEDDELTRGRTGLSPDEEVPEGADIRKRFQVKERHTRFRDLFPIDVINLDPYGVFFPPRDGIHSTMLQAIERIFEWQANAKSQEDNHHCEGFTLILTTHVREADYKKTAVDDLVTIARENIRDHEEYATAFKERHGHLDPDLLRTEDFSHFFSAILPKIIAGAARRHGWFGTHRHIYLYTSEERSDYHMMSSVTCYKRLAQPAERLPTWTRMDNTGTQEYLNEMCNILRYKPVDVNLTLSADANLTSCVKDHLASVVQYRDSFIASLR